MFLSHVLLPRSKQRPSWPALRNHSERSEANLPVPDRPSSPEEPSDSTRKESISMRVAPAEKELIEQEASRRGITTSMLLTSVGFEEIQPAGRAVPSPKISGWLYDKGQDLIGDAEGHLAFLPSRILEHAADLKLKSAEVRMRQEAREDLWEEAASSSRSKRIGARLTGRKKEWVRGEASRRGTSMSTLLRDSTLEGISKRNRMAQTASRLSNWSGRTDMLAGRDAPAQSGVRDEMATIGQEICRFAEKMLG